MFWHHNKVASHKYIMWQHQQQKQCACVSSSFFYVNSQLNFHVQRKKRSVFEVHLFLSFSLLYALWIHTLFNFILFNHTQANYFYERVKTWQDLIPTALISSHNLFIYLNLSGHGFYRSRRLLFKPNNNSSKLKILVYNHKNCLIWV